MASIQPGVHGSKHKLSLKKAGVVKKEHITITSNKIISDIANQINNSDATTYEIKYELDPVHPMFLCMEVINVLKQNDYKLSLDKENEKCKSINISWLDAEI